MEQQQPAAGIHVEIGELMLEGFAQGERHRIGAAVERELARLIGERGWREGTRGVELLAGGAFHIAAGAQPEQIGAQIASAVYTACGGQGE